MTMRKKDAFTDFHPLVNMLYFVLVIGCSFVLMHPVCLGVSLACGVSYMLLLDGRKALRICLLFLLPVLLLTVFVNPAFSHQGATILTYFPNGNPITLESILYGVAAACMLVTVISWFRCFTAIMTSDKFVYLFGRVIPALSLVLSMALRFAPRFAAQAKVISAAQKGIGRDISQGSLLQKAKHSLRILSILITWALENAIDTADSMKSRGYGLPGRSAFSIFRFEKRDRLALAFLLLCGGSLILGIALDRLKFDYYPLVGGAWETWSFALFAVYTALCALPLLINLREDVRWKAHA